MLQALSVAVDRGRSAARSCGVVTSNGDHYEARAVLIATGSTYRRTGAMGEDDLIGAGIHFCATCDGPFYKGSEELLVLGGGNSGLEEGLFLAQFTDKVDGRRVQGPAGGQPGCSRTRWPPIRR